MPDCVFCKIVEGKLPSTKIFEDEHSIAMFDINPVATGHTLFITKEHYPTFLDVPSEKIGVLFINMPRVISAILQATAAEGFNVIQNNHRCAGQLISHLHFHIIPRHTADQIHFNWKTQPYQKDKTEELAKVIRQKLANSKR
ncbi:MAG: HIT family protein [Planctomycetota bacterium]|nr:HIT family protein [Planctomycetota bacterium]MDI6787471.1 HIT family protein [Planctomycetota bacterium]